MPRSLEWIIKDMPELRIVLQELQDKVKAGQQTTRRDDAETTRARTFSCSLHATDSVSCG